jgi:serine/threonine protein kinase
MLSPSSLEGAKIGRYMVLGMLGTGGMGLVLRAHDPELDRTIALKLVRPDRATKNDHVRLLREARAMARLSHPNVIPVYDAGTYEGQVFVAMEFVEGQTLKQWLAERPRPWRDVLDILVAAGRGIEAAHAAELVHRDIKPANVLIGRDGRVRVSDFGLARPALAVENAQPRSLSDPLSGEITPGGSSELSRLAGTPAYMAPERLRGQADARSDQFSFAVTLYLALFGRHPFEGSTHQEVVARIEKQEVRPPPEGSEVPESVFSVITRALHPRSEDRYHSMGALLDELAEAVKPTVLTQGPQRRAKPIFSVTKLSLGIVVGSLFALVAGFVLVSGASRSSNRGTARSGVVSASPGSPPVDDARVAFDVQSAVSPQKPSEHPVPGKEVILAHTSTLASAGSRSRPSGNVAAPRRASTRHERKQVPTLVHRDSTRTKLSEKRATAKPPSEDDDLKPLDEELLWRAR